MIIPTTWSARALFLDEKLHSRAFPTAQHWPRCGVKVAEQPDPLKMPESPPGVAEQQRPDCALAASAEACEEAVLAAEEGYAVAAHSVRGGKGFGTPGMFDFLPLRRYRPDDPRHAELAELSRRAHVASRNESSRVEGRLVAELQRRIDELASASGW